MATCLILHLDIVGLSGGRKKDEDGDENKEGIAKKPQHAKQDRKPLSEGRRDPRCLLVSNLARQDGSENPASVHWKRRDEIEDKEHQIGHRNLREKIGLWLFDLRELSNVETVAE